MNATILMRIMPDLRSKYAIRVDGETVGDLETLDEALLALERLRFPPVAPRLVSRPQAVVWAPAKSLWAANREQH